MLECQVGNIKRSWDINCEKSGHYKSARNIVCLAKDCDSRGLICIYCLQHDHMGHKFMGFEQYLEELMRFRNQNFKQERQLEGIRTQMRKRYQELQLKISELSSNLEILTHQVKSQYEEDLQSLMSSSKSLQLRQDAFISEDFCESSKSLLPFIESSFEFVNYSYDDVSGIKVNDFCKAVSQLEQYESRFNQIEEIITVNMKAICEAQQEVTQIDLHNIDNLDSTTLTHIKHIPNAHMHRISTIIVLTGYSNHLYSASHDGYIKMWDLKTLVCLRVLKSSFSRIWLALLHLPSLNSLIALTNDNTLHLINPKNLKTIKRISIPSTYSSCPQIALVPGHASQIVVASGSKIFVIDVITEEVVYTTDTNGYYIYSFDIWTDGNYKYIIYGDKAGKLYANEMKTKTAMPAIDKAHEDKIVDVKVLRDSNYVITASSDKFIKVWKMPVLQYIGGWESKGIVDGLIAVQNLLVVKERDSQRLHAIFQDHKGSCKKKPYVKINPGTEGAFFVCDFNRSVISTSFVENRENTHQSDILIEYY